MMKPLPAAHRLRFISAVLLLALGATAVRATPPELKVAGAQLVDAATGQPVRLRGVNCASLEWSADGEGHIAKSVQVAVTEWHANLIRLPLSQDSWFGKGSRQADGGGAYRELVKEIVDFCTAHDAYLLLDLHWSDGGEWGENIGQHNLPDKNSLIFWRDVAKIYRDDPAVLFDLYNEPNHTDWETWRRGGEVTETDERTKEKASYKGIGMQTLIDAIRSVGAKNVVVASGVDWAYDLDGILAGHALADPRGRGVVYAIHVYPHPFESHGRESIAQVTARIEAFAQKFPVFVGEFGSNAREWPFPKDSGYTDEKWNREFLATLEAQGWNWTAWDFHPTAGPCLIADWNYTPTPSFGALVKEALAKNLPAAAAAK